MIKFWCFILETLQVFIIKNGFEVAIYPPMCLDGWSNLIYSHVSNLSVYVCERRCHVHGLIFLVVSAF